MVCEINSIKKEKYNDKIIYIINDDEKAEKYVHSLTTPPLGTIYNKWGKLIGIDTLQEKEIYSPEYLINNVLTKAHNSVLREDESIIRWWNNTVYNNGDEKREYDDYDEVILKIEDLETYFTKTVEKKEEHTDIKWTTYYINPSCGFSVKIGSTEVCYSTQNIDKITICEDYEGNTLSFHDKTDFCVEDIDIVTKEPLENIRFIFEYVDLKRCNTQNKEHQYYAELWEKLNPYNSVEENRKILNEYYNKIKEYEEEYYGIPAKIKLETIATYTGEIYKVHKIKDVFRFLLDNSKVTFDFSNVKYMSRDCAEEYLRQIRVKNIRSTEVNVNDEINDLLDDVLNKHNY